MNRLPNEILFRIMYFLIPINCINLGKTNKKFKKLVNLNFINLLKKKLTGFCGIVNYMNKDCMLTGKCVLELLLNGETTKEVKCIDLVITNGFSVFVSFLINNGFSLQSPLINVFVDDYGNQINISSKSKNVFRILDNYFDGYNVYFSSYLINNSVEIIDMNSILNLPSRLYDEIKFDIIHYQKHGFKFKFKYINKTYNNIAFGNGKGIKIF
jgi:hypothetical protein